MRLDPDEEAADRDEDAYIDATLGRLPDPWTCRDCGRTGRPLDHYDRCAWCARSHHHKGTER